MVYRRNQLIIFLLFIMVAGIAFFSKVVPIDFSKLTSGAVGTQLLTLIFIALVIERAVEVYINNFYMPLSLKASLGIRLEDRNIKSYQVAMTAETERMVPQFTDPDARAAAEDQKRKLIEEWGQKISDAQHRKADQEAFAIPKLEELRTRKSATAATAATAMGALVAIAGVHTLGVLGQLNAVEPFQEHVFKLIDMSLTALLLAGGADGIHQILKKFLKASDDITGV
jgi:hypothetical protein